MRNSNHQHRFWIGALLVLSTLLPSPVIGSTQTQLVVIVNKESKLDHISLDDLRRIFRSDRFTDPDGKRFIPFNQAPKQSGRIAFDRIVLNLEPDQVGNYWIDRRVRGEPNAPRTIEDVTLLRNVIARLPGSISYLRAEQVTNEVKTLRVDKGPFTTRNGDFVLAGATRSTPEPFERVLVSKLR